MIRINENYLKLAASYLFSEIGKRVAAFQQAHPDREVIKMGIGDVTRPLPAACISAFQRAVAEMGTEGGFRGYGPEQGYAFLRDKIAEFDYQKRGVSIASDEIFVSDGSKCDVGNIEELFARDIKIGIPDPVYPVYVDTNVMAGRTGKFIDGRYEGLTYLECTEKTGYAPVPPSEKLDLVYLCSPNNPTGAVMTRDQLAGWVEYAKASRALLLFDSAYVSFVSDPSLPQSIYEVEGAAEVAVEFRSFSKTAGFTGTRCAYTVVPKALCGYDAAGGRHSLHSLWLRRHATKFNGVSYPVQRAAEAVYGPEGREQVRELTDFYLGNAHIISRKLVELGYPVVGGEHAPYIWFKTGGDSWNFFDTLLETAGIVCTPGSGFGRCGEGYVRLSAFNSRENVEKAMARFPAMSV